MSDQKTKVGYVVSTWPSLSQTFVLNEILALERLGVPLRIFSVKDPGGEPVHGALARVRASINYLSFRRHWRSIIPANYRLAREQPQLYFGCLGRAAGYFRWGALKHFLEAAYLTELLRQEPVVRLHAHFATAPGLVAMFAHWLSGIRYSFTAHARDIYVDQKPGILRAEMKSADAVVTVSEYNRRYLSTEICPSANGKVRCIYNGLDLRDFSFQLPRASQLEPPMILSVGRLIEKKGLVDLLLACELLRRRGRPFQVEIIGTGPWEDLLKAQAKRLGLTANVKFLGAQPQEVVRKAFHRATVFALPCIISGKGDRDGIPTVLMEAMASGTPVVSTSISGIPELIESGKDGLLVPPNNASLLAGALDQLLNAPELRENLARAARAKMEARFSIEESARELRALFENGVSP